MSYAADKQTDKQTDSIVLPTPTDIIGVDNQSRSVAVFNARDAVAKSGLCHGNFAVKLSCTALKLLNGD